MVGIFCTTKAKSVEEYGMELKNKTKGYAALGILGIMTIALAFLAELTFHVQINSEILGFYMGIGSGLIAAALVLFLKKRSIIKNPAKLKSDWIESSDERNKEISFHAFRTAAILTLCALYVLILICGIWYPVMIKFAMFFALLPSLSYATAFRIYERRN